MSVFHALALLTLCLIPFASCSLPLGTAGVLYPSIVSYLGLSSTAELSAYQTFMSFAQIVTLVFAGKIIARYDARIVLTITSAMIGGAFLAMSQFNAVWQWYVAGIVQGIGLAFNLYVAIPTLITRWFANRIGFFVGLCFSFSSIGGIVFSIMAGQIVSAGAEAWRTAYLVFGIIVLATTLPFTGLALRNRPSDVGVDPYRGKNAPQPATPAAASSDTGITFSQALRTPAFWFLLLFAGIVTFTCISLTILPTFAGSLAGSYPATAAAAATLISCCSIGGMIGKFVIGALCDKNEYIAVTFAVACGIVGFLMIWQMHANVMLFLTGGIFFGFFFSSSTVVPPVVCRSCFGNADYSNIWSRTSTVAQIFGALANVVWGLLAFGDFTAFFSMGIAGMVLTLVFGCLAISLGKKVLPNAERS